MNAKSQKLTLYTVIALVVAVVAIILYVQFRPEPTPDVSGELVLEGQPSLGSEDAPVKIATFEDFKCPACRRFEEEVFPRLKREFVETGQVELFFINLPFIGPDSTTAAIAGECAYQQDEAAFWEYKTYIFRAQGPESQVWATPERLVEIAAQYVPSLDSEALRTCIEERRYEDEVAADKAMGNSIGVNATPSAVVNGELLESASYQSVSAAIEDALNE